jgi:hypothetical protein
MLTLRTKLRNAAVIKKYLLLTFIFFLGGLGSKLHERLVSAKSVSGMASPRTTSQRQALADPGSRLPGPLLAAYFHLMNAFSAKRL